jgi:hypothetical protein
LLALAAAVWIGSFVVACARLVPFSSNRHPPVPVEVSGITSFVQGAGPPRSTVA